MTPAAYPKAYTDLLQIQKNVRAKKRTILATVNELVASDKADAYNALDQVVDAAAFWGVAAHLLSKPPRRRTDFDNDVDAALSASLDACVVEELPVEKGELPHRLSGLLRLAVRDVRAIARDPLYVINMSEWHTPRGNDTCSVCMAGAVLAHTKKLPRRQHWECSNHDDEPSTAKFRAIDYMRTGLFDSAYRILTGKFMGSFAANTQDDDLGLGVDQIRALHEASALVSRAHSNHTHHAPWRVYGLAARVLERVGL